MAEQNGKVAEQNGKTAEQNGKTAEQNGKTPATEEHTISELEALLRTKMGDGLIVEKYKATDFLPPGENYGSLILKVDAVIRRKGKDSESEELHMIAKVPPLTEKQREFFDSPFTFSKEAFMYETILPTYKQFERDCGISEKELFDVGPALYGSRMNLEFGEEFDDHAVIIMENLKTRGYYSGSRFTGLDIHHSKMAVKTIARFHALGIAMKQKKPDFFEVLKVRSKCLAFKDTKQWENVIKDMLRSIKEDPEMTEHFESCVRAFQSSEGGGNWTNAPEEPWSTIIHADFWINNILFHRNEETGLPDDVKFVDYQNYLFMSPLRELGFLLGSMLDHEVSTKNIPELIDLYHETLMSRLEIMNCDGSPYSREKFDARLPKDASHEFVHSVFMLKITTRNVDVNDPNSKDVENGFSGPGSEEFYTRMRDLVKGYAQRGWFC